MATSPRGPVFCLQHCIQFPELWVQAVHDLFLLGTTKFDLQRTKHHPFLGEKGGTKKEEKIKMMQKTKDC